MTPGTNCDHTARGALHCGLRGPPFTPDKWAGEFESSLHTQSIFHVCGPKAGSHMNTSVSVYWHALILSFRAEVLKLCLTQLLEVLRCDFVKKKREKKKTFFNSSPCCLNCFCPAIDRCSWATPNLFNRWCHWIASLLSLCVISHSVLSRCEYAIRRVCFCANDYTPCTSSFTDHSL